MNLDEDLSIRLDEGPDDGEAYVRGPGGTFLRVPRHVHEALVDDPLREIPASAPLVRPLAGGTLATVVDRGLSKTRNGARAEAQQDAHYVVGDGFGIVDGMGGWAYAEVAAKILAESLRDADLTRTHPLKAWDAAVHAATRLMLDAALVFWANHSLTRSLRETFLAHRHDPAVLRAALPDVPPSGAVFCACAFLKGSVHVGWLGDAQAALVRGGEVAYFVSPHRPQARADRGLVERCVGSHVAPQTPSYVEWPTLPGDMVVCASDGFWDQPGVMEALVHAGGLEDASASAAFLADFALRAMGASGGKPDNLSLHVWRAA